MSAPAYDAVVVGGGLVGASLACALADAGARVAVVEARPLATGGQPSFDDRALALTPSSRAVLEGLGLWPAVAAQAEPIRRVHVSERGRFGVTRIDAREQGVEALGHVVEARHIGEALMARLGAQAGVDHRCPARFAGLVEGSDRIGVRVAADGGETLLEARLLVAADGAGSPVRAALGLGERTRDYGQVAVIANVEPGRPGEGTAYERFTPDGPIAMLPMTAGRYKAVWTVPGDRAEEVASLDDASFLAALQAGFGHRLGTLRRAGVRSSYPLRRVLAREQVAPRAVLLGNAAHALHPIAAQGFNLALRDVAALAERVADALAEGSDPGREDLLRGYLAERLPDQRALTAFIELLNVGFSGRWRPPGPLRSLGLLGFDLVPPLRHALARRAMGLGVGRGRLARGRPVARGGP